MIVDSMSYEEIIREYEYVHNNYLDTLKHKVDRDAMRRFLIKNKNVQDYYFKDVTVKVDENTLFLAIPSTKNYQDFKKILGPRIALYLLFRTSSGWNVITRGGLNDNLYVFFYSHLFDRYRERHIKDTSLSKRETIRDFFIHNQNFTGIEFPTESRPNNVLIITDDGVIFGESPIKGRLQLYKTFILKEQLKENQFDTAMKGEEHLTLLKNDRKRLEEFVMSCNKRDLPAYF